MHLIWNDGSLPWLRFIKLVRHMGNEGMSFMADLFRPNATDAHHIFSGTIAVLVPGHIFPSRSQCALSHSQLRTDASPEHNHTMEHTKPPPEHA